MIRPIARLVLTFALGLWIGGLVWLFASVSKLFAIDREMAVLIAPTFFSAFNRYQVTLGLIAVIAAVITWWLGRRKPTAVPLACVLTAMIVVAGIFMVTRRLESIRLAGLSGGDEFKRLHGVSMVLYLATAVLTAIALAVHTLTTGTPTRVEQHGSEIASSSIK